MLGCFLRLFNPRWESRKWSRLFGDEDHLEFAPMEVVADDDLVAVSFERLAGFWEEE